MNVITIEFCAEDRARLDRLSEALERRSRGTCVAEDTDPDQYIKRELAELIGNASKPAEAPSHPVEESSPFPDPAPTPEPPVSLPAFQKALSLRCAESEDMKAKVRALLHEYAMAASQVPEEKRAEVLDRLAKL